MRVIRSADCALVPWANGGGVTRDLAVGMPAAGVAVRAGGPAFDWRLSLADIDRDGPFSVLAGVDRVFAPVDGAVVLRFADGPLRLAADAAPLAFDGETAPAAALPDGARCRALNLQLARGRCVGALRRVALADGDTPSPDPGRAVPAGPSASGAAPVHACFVQAGSVACGAALAGPGDLLLLDAGDPLPRAVGAAVLLVVSVAPRAASAPMPDNAGSTR